MNYWRSDTVCVWNVTLWRHLAQKAGWVQTWVMIINVAEEKQARRKKGGKNKRTKKQARVLVSQGSWVKEKCSRTKQKQKARRPFTGRHGEGLDKAICSIGLAKQPWGTSQVHHNSTQTMLWLVTGCHTPYHRRLRTKEERKRKREECNASRHFSLERFCSFSHFDPKLMTGDVNCHLRTVWIARVRVWEWNVCTATHLCF